MKGFLISSEHFLHPCLHSVWGVSMQMHERSRTTHQTRKSSCPFLLSAQRQNILAHAKRCNGLLRDQYPSLLIFLLLSGNGFPDIFPNPHHAASRLAPISKLFAHLHFLFSSPMLSSLLQLASCAVAASRSGPIPLIARLLLQ